MELLWKLSTFHIVFIQWNLLDHPKCKIRKLWFVLIFCYYYQNKIMVFFLQRNKNISLDYYDFPNHFSGLLFYRRIRKDLCSKRNIHTVGNLKINISRKLLFFSRKRKKSQCYEHELKFVYYISLFNQMQKCMSH